MSVFEIVEQLANPRLAQAITPMATRLCFEESIFLIRERRSTNARQCEAYCFESVDIFQALL